MKNPKLQFKLFLLLIIIGSSIPGKSVPEIVTLSWDKLLHFIEYSILGALGYRAYHKHPNFNIYLLCSFGILFGYIDESWQKIIPGRFSSHSDVIADGIGVIFGTLTSHYIKNKKYDRKIVHYKFCSR